jgi:polyferredoxin
LPDGRIENVYMARIINKDTRVHDFRLEVEGLPHAVVDGEQSTYRVGPGEVFSAAVRVRAAPEHLHGGHDIEIESRAVDDPSIHASAHARFIAPATQETETDEH